MAGNLDRKMKGLSLDNDAIASRRIKQELDQLKKDPPPFCIVEQVEEEMFHWRATITGPPDSPFSGGKFLVDIHLPDDYPFETPQITFETKIFHPNINSDGIIQLDMIKNWTFRSRVKEVLISVCALLSDPNPDDPLEPEIGRMFVNNRAKYDTVAKSWTAEYAVQENKEDQVLQEEVRDNFSETADDE